MVNQSGNTAVGVVLGVLGSLLFGFLEVEELPLKTQVQLAQDHLYFPRTASQVVRYVPNVVVESQLTIR